MIKKIGVIGSGYTANQHIEAILKLGADVIGIASRPGSETTVKLAKKFKIPKLYASAKALIAEIEFFDALVICTPADAVPQILSLVGDKSIPILIEKPAISYINSLENFKSMKLYVAYNRRFYETVKIFKEMLSPEEGFYQIQIVEDKLEISNRQEMCKVICNNSVHYFDLLHFFYGKYSIDKVSAMPGFGGFTASIKSVENFQIGIINIYFGSPTNSSITYQNSTYNLELKPLETLNRYNYLGVTEPNAKYKIRQYKPGWTPQSEKQTIFEDSSIKPGYYQQMKAFLNSASSTTERNSLATILDAEFAFSIADALCKKIENF